MKLNVDYLFRDILLAKVGQAQQLQESQPNQEKYDANCILLIVAYIINLNIFKMQEAQSIEKKIQKAIFIVKVNL